MKNFSNFILYTSDHNGKIASIPMSAMIAGVWRAEGFTQRITIVVGKAQATRQWRNRFVAVLCITVGIYVFGEIMRTVQKSFNGIDWHTIANCVTKQEAMNVLDKQTDDRARYRILTIAGKDDVVACQYKKIK